MDSDIIYMIILGVIALLSQLLTKRKKPQANHPTPTHDGGTTTGRKRKPFSFEDILKEFETELQGKEQTREIYEEEPVEVPVEEEESLATKPSEYQSYEGTNFETATTDDEDIDSKIKKYKRDDHYNLEEISVHPIIHFLKEKDGPKKAVILSEIMNRKYD